MTTPVDSETLRRIKAELEPLVDSYLDDHPEIVKQYTEALNEMASAAPESHTESVTEPATELAPTTQIAPDARPVAATAAENKIAATAEPAPLAATIETKVEAKPLTEDTAETTPVAVPKVDGTSATEPTLGGEATPGSIPTDDIDIDALIRNDDAEDDALIEKAISNGLESATDEDLGIKELLDSVSEIAAEPADDPAADVEVDQETIEKILAAGPDDKQLELMRAARLGMTIEYD